MDGCLCKVVTGYRPPGPVLGRASFPFTCTRPCRPLPRAKLPDQLGLSFAPFRRPSIALRRAMHAQGPPTLVHHLINPPYPYGVLWPEGPEHLLCGVPRVPLTYRADAD